MATPYDTPEKRRAAGIPEATPVPSVAGAVESPKSRSQAFIDRLRPSPGGDSLAGKVGYAIRSIPHDTAVAVRDAYRDPMDAIGRATAPFAGGSSLLGAGGSLANLTVGAGDTARTLAGASAAGRLGRSLLPSARTAAGAAAATGAGLLALGEVDSADSAADPAMTLGARAGVRRRGGGIMGAERQAAFARQRARDEAAAAAPEAKPDFLPQVSVDTAVPQLRGNQGAIIRNPAAMSTVDQLAQVARGAAFRGSPSMRKAAAEAILGEANAVEAGHQAALTRNSTENAGNAELQNAFADRRLKQQAANAELSEGRRTGDLNRQVVREGNLLDTLRAGRGGKAPESTTSRLYEDYLKAGMDPRRAAEQAANATIDVGEDPSLDPLGSLGRTVSRDRVEQGMNAYNDRWFGWGNDKFDASSATPRSQTIGEQFWAGLPGGRDRDDVVWEDAAGQTQYSPASALGGDTPEAYRQRLNRERLLRNQGN